MQTLLAGGDETLEGRVKLRSAGAAVAGCSPLPGLLMLLLGAIKSVIGAVHLCQLLPLPLELRFVGRRRGGSPLLLPAVGVLRGRSRLALGGPAVVWGSRAFCRGHRHDNKSMQAQMDLSFTPISSEVVMHA